MRRAAIAALLALPLALAACGDGETTTVTETVPATETGPPSETGTTEAEGEAGSGPSGELSSSGVGAAQRGASTESVASAFGEPDERLEAAGCELAGPNAPRVLIWTYELGDGELRLTFVAASGAFSSYRTDSAELQTARGDRVGDPFASVKANWGAELEPLALGAKPTAERGFWWVRDGKRAELLFDIRGGSVAEIQGGEIEICE